MNTSLIKKGLIPVIAIIVLLLMVAWLAGTFDDKVAPGLQKKDHLSGSVNTSEHFIMSYSEEMSYEPVSAVIEAKQATIISTRILARIESIKVRAGDMVKKGDVLIELEKSDLASQVYQAQEKINGLTARYEEAEKNLTRAHELDEKKLIAVSNLDKTKADFQSVEAELTASKQALKEAETTLSYATIISPIDGKIVDRFAEPGDTAQQGNKLLSLYNPLYIRVEANVRERLALNLNQGQSLSVEIPSINKNAIAQVEEIVPAANTGSRSFLIKASINYSHELMPGMYARILIPSKTQQILHLPNNKIEHVGQLDFVWILVNDELQRRFVRLGKTNKHNETVVLSGLSEDDIVVNPPLVTPL